VKKARTELLLIGPRRARAGEIKVRVVVDKSRDLITVEMPKREKRSYPNTRDGRAEAQSFARAFYAEAVSPKPAAIAVVPTVRELFHRYAEAMFGDLRPKTRVGHRNRWRPWEIFAGHDTAADAITLEHMDRFKAELQKQGYVANQVGKMLGMVKQVFRWGVERRALVASDVVNYRIRMPADAEVIEPPEYRIEDFEKLVPAIGSPRDVRCWRAWAVLMIVGHQGARANAILRLRLTDVVGGRLHWRKASDKRRREWSQPMRWGAYSAVLTCLWWRERDGYTGPWLIYPRPKAAKDRADRGGRTWPDEHGPYTYAAFYQQLRAAELAAKVPHADYRAAHGFRKMVAGEILRATNNPKLAMDFIGDRDLTLIKDYLKVREDEKDGAATLLDAADETRNMHPSHTQPTTAEHAEMEVVQ
jgi:hypothetical protein